MKPNNAAIGVFDSGLGGISVLREIQRLLPAEQLIYVADSAYAPYGAKSPATIRERCLRVSEFLVQQQVKALVVACNTATVHAVAYLREHLSIPVVGIEPAVKPAAQLTRSGVVGVLATEQTVQSPRLRQLVSQYAGNVDVLLQACPGLVEHVEAGDFQGLGVCQLLRNYISPLLDAGADTLVLGCTHYPFLRPTIQHMISARLQILETSIPVAQQLRRVLQQQQLLQVSPTYEQVRFVSSKHSQEHHRSMQLLWGQELNCERLPAVYC